MSRTFDSTSRFVYNKRVRNPSTWDLILSKIGFFRLSAASSFNFDKRSLRFFFIASTFFSSHLLAFERKSL